MERCVEELTSDGITATTQAVEIQDSSSPWVCSVLTSLQCSTANADTQTLSIAEIKQAQQEDKDIAPVLQCKLEDKIPLGQEFKTLSALGALSKPQVDGLDFVFASLLFGHSLHQRL